MLYLCRDSGNHFACYRFHSHFQKQLAHCRPRKRLKNRLVYIQIHQVRIIVTVGVIFSLRFTRFEKKFSNLFANFNCLHFDCFDGFWLITLSTLGLLNSQRAIVYTFIEIRCENIFGMAVRHTSILGILLSFSNYIHSFL